MRQVVTVKPRPISSERFNIPERRKITYDEFLEWCDEDTLAEWVDGEIIMVSPASDRHQDISDFLTSLLRIYVEGRGLGWIRSAPFQTPLPSLLRVLAEIAGVDKKLGKRSGE